MARVLVTGGSGFIGRYLVERLLRRGDDVRVLDLTQPDGARDGIEFIHGSITDRRAADPAVDGVDCVYHLAGIAHLWRRDKADFDRVNRGGTETMLNAAAAAGVPHFLHCSTESIMLPRRRDGKAVDESALPPIGQMAGPYTRSKHRAESAALNGAGKGMHVVIVNPTVPIGLGDRNMTPPAEMLKLFLSGGSPFFLDCVLNLVDVRDVASGMIAAAERGRAGERYVLGGENIALRDLLPVLQRLSGRRMPRHVIPSSLAMVTGRVAGWLADNVTRKPPIATKEGVLLALRSAPFDSGKARRELGYQPRPVEAALTEVVAAFTAGRADRHGDVRKTTKSSAELA